jgi:hypothetical protein
MGNEEISCPLASIAPRLPRRSVARLHLSRRTAGKHVGNLLRETGARSRTHLLRSPVGGDGHLLTGSSGQYEKCRCCAGPKQIPAPPDVAWAGRQRRWLYPNAREMPP